MPKHIESKIGQLVNLAIDVPKELADTVTWRSSDPDVAIVVSTQDGRSASAMTVGDGDTTIIVEGDIDLGSIYDTPESVAAKIAKANEVAAMFKIWFPKPDQH